MSDRKVKVESMVNYAVVLTEPYSRFERVFNRDMQSALIDFEIMEQGLQDNGFRKMFTDGLLNIPNKEDKIDLNLLAADGEEADDEIEEIFAISTGEIVKLLKSKDYEQIQKIVDKSSDDIVRNMISIAIKFKLTDSNIVDILQKRSPNGAEIYKLISLAKDAEKEIFDFED